MEFIDNDSVNEFIKLFSKEPILWDPNHKHAKRRNLVTAAWIRIRNGMPEHHTIDILKRKKNSLMASYRDCLRKIRDSSMKAALSEEVYQPSWFAFDAMHEFLGPIYQNRPSFNTEVYLLPEGNDDADDNTEYVKWPPIRENKVQRKDDDSDDCFMNSDSDIHNEEPQSLLIQRTIKRPAANRRESSSDDECDIYGKLVATKLKKLNVKDRLRLMNDIDNLVYKHVMSVRSRDRPCSSTS